MSETKKFVTRGGAKKHKSLESKYCSCLVKVESKKHSKAQNPYAVCTASVYGSRGLKGPGRVSCQYDSDFLSSLSRKQLYQYLKEKGFLLKENDVKILSKDTLKELVWEYWKQRDKIAPRFPPTELETDIKKKFSKKERQNSYASDPWHRSSNDYARHAPQRKTSYACGCGR